MFDLKRLPRNRRELTTTDCGGLWPACKAAETGSRDSRPALSASAAVRHADPIAKGHALAAPEQDDGNVGGVEELDGEGALPDQSLSLALYLSLSLFLSFARAEGGGAISPPPPALQRPPKVFGEAR